MSIALTRAQAVALTKLIVADVIDDETGGDVLLTAQGSGTVYAAFASRSFTILLDGRAVEEDFG